QHQQPRATESHAAEQRIFLRSALTMRVAFARTVLLMAVVGIAAAALVGCDDSPAAPMAQTRIDVRVRDFINPKLGNLVPLPVVNGTLSGNFAASMWDGSQWVNVGSPNATTVPLQVISARIDAAP